MDSWYASLKNLKLIASFGWFFLTRLKSNRLVNPNRQGNRPIREVAIPPEGRVVHWACPGISDGFPKRGRGILGDQ
jgi:putative transposase